MAWFSKKEEGSRTIRRDSLKRKIIERIMWFFSFAYFLFYWENNAIDVTRFERTDSRIPKSLDGLTIVQISDLHAKRFGRDNARLLKKVKAQKPDLIAITGDLIDARRPDVEFARELVAQLVALAPVLYVSGNHEGEFIEPYREKIFQAIREGGAILLDSKSVEITRDENGRALVAPVVGNEERDVTPNSVFIAGIKDPVATYSSWVSVYSQYRVNSEIVQDLLDATPVRREQYSILLTHRPEHFPRYARRGFDLALAGHAHGGQFRFPFFLPNGLYAPDQGLFPKRTSGLYELDGSSEIVSRGLGPSAVPTRLFNRPNLVVCALRSASARSNAKDDESAANRLD